MSEQPITKAICLRLDDPEHRPVPGAESRRCAACNAEVWASPETIRLIDQNPSVRVTCMECTVAELPDEGLKVALPPAHARELASLGYEAALPAGTILKKRKKDLAAKPKTAAPTSPELTLSELLAHVFASDIRFQFVFIPDNEPARRYGALVDGEEAYGSEPVAAILSALALGVRKEQARTERHGKELETRRKRIAEISRRIPGLSAHEPTGEAGEKCGDCGEVHSPRDMVEGVITGALEKAFGGKVILKRIDDPTKPKKDKGKKNPN